MNEFRGKVAVRGTDSPLDDGLSWARAEGRRNMKTLVMAPRRPERTAAMLFAACPKCLVGDLSVLLVDGEYLAACVQCEHVGVLCSVYPPPVRRPANRNR